MKKVAVPAQLRKEAVGKIPVAKVDVFAVAHQIEVDNPRFLPAAPGESSERVERVRVDEHTFFIVRANIDRRGLLLICSVSVALSGGSKPRPDVEAAKCAAAAEVCRRHDITLGPPFPVAYVRNYFEVPGGAEILRRRSEPTGEE